jgi:hypothetical protein
MADVEILLKMISSLTWHDVASRRKEETKQKIFGNRGGGGQEEEREIKRRGANIHRDYYQQNSGCNWQESQGRA